jgi:hypothetical protein
MFSTSLKIKVVVVCLSLAANVVRFGNVNADEFISRQFVLSLSGTVFLQCKSNYHAMTTTMAPLLKQLK